VAVVLSVQVVFDGDGDAGLVTLVVQVRFCSCMMVAGFDVAAPW